MAKRSKTKLESSDSAAVFAASLSLWQACNKRASAKGSLNLSECYNGMDQFMREIMRIANHFEEWACSHIEFMKLEGLWPYLLEDKFGESCLAVIKPNALVEFNDVDCLRIAIHLQLPVKFDAGLRFPSSKGGKQAKPYCKEFHI